MCEISNLFCPVFCLSPLASTFALTDDHSELFGCCWCQRSDLYLTFGTSSRAETHKAEGAVWVMAKYCDIILGRKQRNVIKISLSAAS